MAHAPTCIIGIDLGGTNMQAIVVDDGDAVRGHAHAATQPERGTDAVIATMAQVAREAMDKAELSIETVAAIGVAAPGAIEMARGIVIDAPNLGWQNVPLRDRITEALGRPTVVENDVNAAAYGEFTIGASSGIGSGMAVWVGTGVGAGIVLEGKLFHGAAHSGSEIGQMVVGPGGHILEQHAGRVGLTRLAREWLPEHTDSMLRTHLESDAQLTTAIIAEALEARDALMLRAFDDATAHLGTAIANCVTLLGLEGIVIGGGVTEALGERLLEPVRAHFREAVFPAAARETPILPTKLTSRAGTLGAAMLARSLHC